MSQIRKKVGSIMVIEIAPCNSLQLFSVAINWLTRCMAFVVGLSVCAMGVSVLLLPGFEADALVIIKSLIGVLLLVCGVAVTRVGTVRSPVNLAFDRATEEWKMSSRRGRKAEFIRAAPRGSVLTLKRQGAALRDDHANALFDLHLDKPARAALMSEYQRMQAAV